MDAMRCLALSTPPPSSPETNPGSSLALPMQATRQGDSPSALRVRKARRHHRETLARLRGHLRSLQLVALALPLLDDADAIWDEFLDGDTRHTRDLLRQLTAANKEHNALRASHAQLETMLAERSLATRAIRALLQGPREDAWSIDVQRWKALARIHFRPWTATQCATELEAALEDRCRFEQDPTKYTSGRQCLGWEDSLRLLRDASALQFSLHKSFRSHDLQRHVDTVARIYRDTELYTKVVLGGRARACVDVLQEITPHIAVVMYHERYEGSEHTVHALNLIATVESDGCVAHYMRSIDAHDVRRAFAGARDVWVNKFYWMQYDLADPRQPRHACDYRASLRGTLEGHDAGYLRLWLFELLAALVRTEAMAAGRSLLTF